MREQTSETIAILQHTDDLVLRSGPSTLEIRFTDTPAAHSVLQQLAFSSTVSALSLRILHIRGYHVFPLIDVYLNAKNAPFDERLQVGSMALYGLRGSSTADSKNPGTGLHESWDVTHVFEIAARQKNWSYHSFTLTFVPQHAFPEGAELSFERIELVVFN